MEKSKLKEIKDEIKRRQALAEDAHRRESDSESPNIRTKEQAWGKLVAYNRCLELLSKI